MNKSKLISIIVVVFILIIGGAYFLYNKLGASVERETIATETTEATEEKKEEPSKKPNAPDFTVKDIDGNKVKLSDFYGKPVIINFWASWCDICVTEMPEFEEAFKTYGEDVQFMMINATDGSRETLKTAQDFIEEKGYTFPVYFDTSLTASKSYNASALPVTYFIDAEGNAIAKSVSYTNSDTLEKGIELIK